jgi:alpha-1,3-mannosyltransferase
MHGLRILHVTKRYAPLDGGVERYVHDLALAQVASGHRVRVLTIDHDVMSRPSHRLPAEETIEGVEIRRVRAIGGPRKQILAEWPSGVLRQLRWSDVIHHHDPRFLFETVLLARAALGRPVVFHTHGMIMHTPRYYRLKRLAMRAYYGPVLGHLVQAVVASSAVDAKLLVDYAGIDPKRIHSYLNAIDLTPYRAIERSPIPGELLVFGRIDEHKGHADLLEALAYVGRPYRLRVAGTGAAEVTSELRRRAGELGISDKVEWLGRVDDATLRRLLGTAQLVLLPSHYEGFGLALLEALAAGATVLASDIAAHREVLGTELAGRLTDLGNPVEAGQAIGRSMDLGAAEVAGLEKAARSRAEEFSIDRLECQIEDLYASLGLVGGE